MDMIPYAYNGTTAPPEHDSYVPMIWFDLSASASIAKAVPSIFATVSVVTDVAPAITSPARGLARERVRLVVFINDE
ncbi:3-glucanase [Diaporthe amygdali]|uniref:3-glucanase n=1 Tax=Phomopsis amygdali TaxID=1214568 RepID=UPI0022FDCC9D|nr:3-glucanase [Diaporthe amygdali]KAJ0103934.1 3-glucanase [Diaporthe amygdali]